MRLIDSGHSGATPAVLTTAAARLFSEYTNRIQRRQYLHTLMDSWLSWYMLVDSKQDMAPPARQRYYSARPASIIDTGRRVLSQNTLRYRVSALHHKSADLEDNGRKAFSALENVLHGVQYDIDRQLSARGEMRPRAQTAFHVLLRGAWAFRMQLTSAVRDSTYTKSPIDYRQLDPRLVLPSATLGGQESLIYFTLTNLATLVERYPTEVTPLVDQLKKHFTVSGKITDWTWLYQPLLMLEWSSVEESATLVDLAGLPEVVHKERGITLEEFTEGRYFWVQAPYLHGLGRPMIQYGNANGLPVTSGATQAVSLAMKQANIGTTRQYDSTGATITHGPEIYLPNGGVYRGSSVNPTAMALTDPTLAMAGRSIIATVSHLFSDYNDSIAMLKGAIHQEVDGTWVLRTQNGLPVAVDIGTGKLNTLSARDDLQKVNAHVQAPDLLGLSQLISQDISDGSLDLRFILAAEQANGGVVRARMEQAALLAITDYEQAVEDWGVAVAESFMTQYARSAGSLKDWQLAGRSPGKSTRYFVVDLDTEVKDLLTAGAQPPMVEAKVKSAMPIDLMARINMAKAAIDPNNPVMGLAMALDIIMEIDDVDSVFEEIMNDVGARNPTIMLMRIAEQFKANGAPEVAQMILDDQFRTAFANSVSSQQGRTATPSGASPSILPSTLQPEIASGGGTEPGAALRNQVNAQQLQLLTGMNSQY